MCKGNKKCRKCSIKLGSTMARKSGSRSVSITTEDVVYAGLGAVVGLAINPLANKALANQSEQVKKVAGTALPVVKVAGGGYVAMNKKQSRMIRMMGLGLAAEGGVELGLRFLPENYVSIAGVTGDNVFSALSGTAVEIPVNPTASASLPTGSTPGFEQEAILGMGVNVHDELAVI